MSATVSPIPPIPADSATGNRVEMPMLAFDALLGELESDAKRRFDAKVSGSPLGPVTGISGLDDRLGNALMPGLHILHGSPGVGKTAFALQVAATCACPALYVTCEMSPLELLRRHTSRISKTFLGKLKDGSLDPASIIRQARAAVATSPYLSIGDATQIPAIIPDIERAAIRTRNRPGVEAVHLLLVIDSLHSWADGLPGGDSLTEYDRLNDALASLRMLSKRLDCPILAIAERNRAARKGGQSAGAGTRKIEYGAETVLELDTDQEDADDDGYKDVKLSISKNRNGSTGKPLFLRWHGSTQTYTEDI